MTIHSAKSGERRHLDSIQDDWGRYQASSNSNNSGTSDLNLSKWKEKICVSKDGSPPGNLKEQLAIEEAMSNPAQGMQIIKKNADPRWPSDEGWIKKAQNVNGVEVHYQYNPNTGQIDDIKIK